MIKRSFIFSHKKNGESAWLDGEELSVVPTGVKVVRTPSKLFVHTVELPTTEHDEYYWQCRSESWKPVRIEMTAHLGPRHGSLLTLGVAHRSNRQMQVETQVHQNSDGSFVVLVAGRAVNDESGSWSGTYMLMQETMDEILQGRFGDPTTTFERTGSTQD